MLKITGLPAGAVLYALLFINFSTASAQKLPNVQTASLRAPANIKVDGKATEWNNQFQAYNKATDVFYTIANDDKKLYLIIKATDEYVIKKMMWGQTVFTVNSSVKKDDDKNIHISYPVIKSKNRPYINLKETPKIVPGNKASVAAADSFMNLSNMRFTEKSKLIKVTGLPNLDTLISIYNADGIKAVGGFDNKMNYIYELSIDLKLLGLPTNGTDKFNYNVKSKELSIEDNPALTITKKDDGTIISIVINKNIPPSSQVMVSTTDFWGEYTLAK